MNTKVKINTKEIVDSIDRAADALIEKCPNVGWACETSGDLMSKMVSTTIDSLGLSKEEHFSSLLQYREDFEKQMKRKYRVKHYDKWGNRILDMEPEYKKRNVPQKKQVFSGFLDLIIGKLWVDTKIIFTY